MSQQSPGTQSKTPGDASAGNNNNGNNPSNAPMAISGDPSSTTDASQTPVDDNSRATSGDNDNDDTNPLDTSAGNIHVVGMDVALPVFVTTYDYWSYDAVTLRQLLSPNASQHLSVYIYILYHAILQSTRYSIIAYGFRSFISEV